MSDDGAGTCSIIELEGAIAGYSRSLHSACGLCSLDRVPLLQLMLVHRYTARR
jgi:hypothetical protein